jgi:hypothetical protein
VRCGDVETQRLQIGGHEPAELSIVVDHQEPSAAIRAVGHGRRVEDRVMQRNRGGLIATASAAAYVGLGFWRRVPVMC